MFRWKESSCKAFEGNSDFFKKVSIGTINFVLPVDRERIYPMLEDFEKRFSQRKNLRSYFKICSTNSGKISPVFPCRNKSTEEENEERSGLISTNREPERFAI